MRTPQDKRRLQLVDNQQQPPAEPVTSLGEPSARQVAAFVALVADSDTSAVDQALDQMGADPVRALAITLAKQIEVADAANGEVVDVGPAGICSIAVATAAHELGVTREAILSAGRQRAVTDARAVAMAAARRAGLTLPAIGAYFGTHHTSVMYATRKVADTPRLDAACARILDQLEEHAARPTATGPIVAATGAGRSAALQLAALDRPSAEADRRREHEPPVSPAVAANATR